MVKQDTISGLVLQVQIFTTLKISLQHKFLQFLSLHDRKIVGKAIFTQNYENFSLPAEKQTLNR